MSDPIPRRPPPLLWIVATGLFMQSLDTILNTALPAMARGIDANPLAMHPAVVSYALMMAMLTPASGWLADRFGLRTTYLGAIALFTLGSIGCAAATSLPTLVAARALQGVGGSMLVPIGRLSIGGSLLSMLSDQLGSTAPAFRWAFLVVGMITLLSGRLFRHLVEPCALGVAHAR